MSVSSYRSARDKKAIGSLRRLSCLGLGSQIAVPAILGELHALIPGGERLGKEILRVESFTFTLDL
jgi:hypothetical protein